MKYRSLPDLSKHCDCDGQCQSMCQCWLDAACDAHIADDRNAAYKDEEHGAQQLGKAGLHIVLK